jgi:hypothetical protein
MPNCDIYDFSIFDLNDDDRFRFRYDADNKYTVVWIHARARLFSSRYIKSTEDIKRGGTMGIALSGTKDISVTDAIMSTNSEDLIVSGFQERPFDYGRCFMARVGEPQLPEDVPRGFKETEQRHNQARTE